MYRRGDATARGVRVRDISLGRIRAYNTPVEPQDNEDIYAWYFKDSWRPTDKLTLNLGVRWEYQHSYLPEQDYARRTRFPDGVPGQTR